jgi:hypothetical protein
MNGETHIVINRSLSPVGNNSPMNTIRYYSSLFNDYTLSCLKPCASISSFLLQKQCVLAWQIVGHTFLIASNRIGIRLELKPYWCRTLLGTGTSSVLNFL